MKKKNDKKKKGLIIAIFAVSILMAVGYAALQANLTINAVGKIYTDWDVEFTDSKCTITSAYNTAIGASPTPAKMECLATAVSASELDKDHLEKYYGGITNDGDDNKGTGALGGLDQIGGVELSLYTEFALPTDTTVFNIEITNFSSMWDAYLKEIKRSVVASSNDTDTNKADWIVYDFNIYANEGSINQVGGLKSDGTTTILASEVALLKAVGTGSTGDNKKVLTVTATWNQLYKDIVPSVAISKEQEFANKGDTDVETYWQKDTFLLTWEAILPGSAIPTPTP